MQSRSKMLAFRPIRQNQGKNTISKVGPGKIHWDPIHMK